MRARCRCLAWWPPRRAPRRVGGEVGACADKALKQRTRELRGDPQCLAKH